MKVNDNLDDVEVRLAEMASNMGIAINRFSEFFTQLSSKLAE